MKLAPWVGRRLPVATNHRGRQVVVWLGSALVLALVVWVLVASALSWVAAGHLRPGRRRLLWVLAGIAITYLAGLYDDYRPARTRGVVRQLAALRHGRVTPGVVKLVAITAAAAFTAWMLGDRGIRFVLAVPVVAGAANVWNLLDVVPGRALKWFLPAAVGLAAASGVSEYRTLAAAAVGISVALLVLDLLELGMLGDGGSNVLGFVVGVGLVDTLSTAGLAIALAAVLVVHALAETVTLSRLIDAAPPLRWFDRLGRRDSRSTAGR